MNILNTNHVEILGTEINAWTKEDFSKKVFIKEGIRYTGFLVFDPIYGDTLRNVRKNSKAKISYS